MLERLRDELRGRLMRQGDAETRLDAFSLQRIMAETEMGISLLQAKAQGHFNKVSEEAVNLAVQHIEEDSKLLTKKLDGAIEVWSIEPAKILADPARKLLAEQHASSLERYGQDLLTGVRQKLFIGLRTGDTVSDIAKGISSMRGPLGTVGEDKANLIARTEVSQVYGAAKQIGIEQVSEDVPDAKKMWIHRSSYDCDLCKNLHGTERPVVGTWRVEVKRKKGPPRILEVSHPPLHPNCTCESIAMKPKWKNALSKLGYLEDESASN